MMLWSLETRKISDLKPYVHNARNLDKKNADELELSLGKFGLCEPIVINTDGLIIGGHQRVAVLKKMGKKEVEVSVPERELNELEIMELNIRLNKIDGDWDWDMLANVFDPFDLQNWGFEDLPAPEKPKKEKKAKITITFPSREQALEAEPMIHELMAHFPEAVDKITL